MMMLMMVAHFVCIPNPPRNVHQIKGLHILQRILDRRTIPESISEAISTSFVKQRKSRGLNTYDLDIRVKMLPKQHSTNSKNRKKPITTHSLSLLYLNSLTIGRAFP